MAGNSLMFALRFILMIPMICGLGYGLLMTKFSQEMQSGQPGFATEIVSKVGIAWLTNRVEKKRDAVVDTASLNDERVVKFSRKVVLADLPGATDATLYQSRAEIAGLVAARQMADTECALIVKSFATACQFSSARVQVGDDGMVRLDYAVSFAGATPIDNLDGLKSGVLVPQRVRLTDRQGIDVAAANVPAEREKFYAAAEDACAGLRVDKGNCVISEMTFAEEPADKGQVSLSASAEIAYLTQSANAGGPDDLTTRGDDGDASMMAFALKAMMAAQRSMTGGDGAEGEGAKPDAAPVDAKTLLDDTELPSFEKTQGGAKFVSPP
jgi:hypothetical protein